MVPSRPRAGGGRLLGAFDSDLVLQEQVGALWAARGVVEELAEQVGGQPERGVGHDPVGLVG
jgi:hypothetical protein